MRPPILRLLAVVPVGLTLIFTESIFAEAVNFDRISQDGAALFRRHEYAQAAALFEEGLAGARRENRADWAAMMLGLLGPVYQCEGKYLEAEDVLNRSIESWTQILGPHAPTLISPLSNLADLYANSGQFARAEKLLSRALAIANDYGREPETEARLLTMAGEVYYEEHKDDLAEQSADEALASIARMKRENPDTLPVYSVLAAVCFRAGRMEEAESWLRKSLAAKEAILPADDPLVADSVANLAMFYSRSDQPEKARPLFERAAHVFDKMPGGESRFLSNFYRVYAEFERNSGHRKEARELSRRADQLWETSAAKALSSQIVDISELKAAK